MISDDTILLVEDNPADEALTLRALGKANIANNVVVARDGLEDATQCCGRPSVHHSI